MAANTVNNRMEVMHFQKTIDPLASGWVEQRVKAPGTVEQFRVRFYPGQQKSLRLRPIVLHKGQKTEPLLSYIEDGDQFLSGDDDYFIFPVVVSVDYDDFIRVYYENTDASNPYTLQVDVIIDYFAGQDRVVGGVVNG